MLHRARTCAAISNGTPPPKCGYGSLITNMKIYVRKLEPEFVDGHYNFRPWALANHDVTIKELEAFFGKLPPGVVWQLEIKRDV